VVNQSDSLTRLYGAIADPTRRAMLDRLQHGPRTVTELGAPFDMTLAAVGKHITTLEAAGLIRSVKRGRVRTCTVVPGGLDDAEQWIRRQREFWNTRLDALTDHLENKP
jgi:DNA-binding transcriptional ArsR family regulator